MKQYVVWIGLALAGLTPAGCSESGSARSGGRSALLERPSAEGGMERLLLQDPAALTEVLAWMTANYQDPPPANEMGAVLAAAGMILSKEGDPTFAGGFERKWAVYGSIETTTRKTLIPLEEINKLVAMFRKSGKPYDGKASTGEYQPLKFTGSPPIIDEEK